MRKNEKLKLPKYANNSQKYIIFVLSTAIEGNLI